MSRLLAAALLTLLCNAVLAAEPALPWEKIRDTAGRYLAACVPAAEKTAMDKKMKDHISMRMQDTACDADRAAREIMFDWAASNQAKLKNKNPKAVAQVCFYFVTFMDKGYYISSKIRESLTPSLVDKIIVHLEDEIKKTSK